MELSDYKKEIEEYFEEYFNNNKGTYNQKIYEAAGYSIKVGGKRIRPALLLMTYGLYKKDYKKVMQMAAAIEMIHTYSLIHDDLPAMDNDDLRRGKPTNHKVFGDAIAILAGDALLNEAMIEMMNFSIKEGMTALRASREIAVAAGAEGMIAGQVVDILSEEKETMSKDELNYMHIKKTGELIRASIAAGAILGEAPESDIEKLNLFGKKLGLAFQIKDDILDIEGSAEKLGKNVKQDEKLNKFNFVTMYGIDKCKKMCETLTKESIDLLDNLTVEAPSLKSLTIKLLNRDN